MLLRISETEGEDRQRAVSEYIAAFGKFFPTVPQIRSMFNGLELSDPGKGNGVHSHPEAAGLRSAASRTAARLAKAVGREPYYYQMSAADQRSGYDGYRTWHWSKDLNATLRQDELTDKHMLIMVDVDEYLPMPKILSTTDVPIVLYTFQPTKCADVCKDYSFRFEGKTVHYTVCGGGKYEHQVWDYGTDSLMVKSDEIDDFVIPLVGWFLPKCVNKLVYKFSGNTTTCTTFHVESRQVDQHHKLILLVPTSRYNIPAIFSGLISGRILKRLDLAVGNFCVMFKQVLNGLTASISCGQACAEIAVEELDGLFAMRGSSATGLTLAAVQRSMPDASMAIAAVVLEYVKSTERAVPMIVYPVEIGSRQYMFDVGTYDPSDKPSMVSFMSPMLHEAFNPTQCRANEAEAIEERILKLRSNARLTPFLERCIEEYVALVIPKRRRGKLRPVSHAEVYKRQKRPTQQAVLKAAGVKNADIVESFMKREAYSGPKPPRVISIYNPTVKLKYSCYTYAFADYTVETCPWYAFGKTPLMIARRVAHICTNAKRSVTKTDMSRMDGRVSAVLRELELQLFIAAFHENDHEELLELLQKQVNLRAYGKYGTKYNTGLARSSGSSETAVLNSHDNAFCAYIAIREQNPDLSPEECYELLGIYGGDDGLTADCEGVEYAKSVAKTGQLLEPAVVDRGQRGVDFLARLYSPDVWFGCLDSMCDLRRQLGKLHVTVALPANVTPEQKLVEKMSSYLLSDRNTPIIGDFANRVVNIKADVQPLAAEHSRLLRSYHTIDVAANEQYPNADHNNWMLDELNFAMPHCNVDAFYEWLDNNGKDMTLKQMLHPPLLLPDLDVPVKKDTVIGHVLHKHQKQPNSGGQHRAGKRGHKA